MPRSADPRTAPPTAPTSRGGAAATLDDVARLAGVSPMTVSRVVNRPELVSAKTIARVRAAIERTGYVPNLLAGGLASRRSRMVAAIVPSITNAIFVETIEALTDRLWSAGYQVVLGLSSYPATREDALLAAVLSRRPDALFLTGINHSSDTRRLLLGARIPIVEAWDLTPTPLDMVIGFSHEKVGEAVARHLHGRGYRRFGIISADDQRALVRQRGYVAELARAGVKAVDVASVEAPSTLALGRAAMVELLDRSRPPRVVFCGSDLLAQGALEEARARGLRVPREVAIMGFGGLDFTAHTAPPISTVAIDRAGIGRMAAEAILARIDGAATPPNVVDVGFTIIDRATT
jgi:LacI family gluconate utilization system Gnt-I transcriptional repressor